MVAAAEAVRAEARGTILLYCAGLRRCRQRHVHTLRIRTEARETGGRAPSNWTRGRSWLLSQPAGVASGAMAPALRRRHRAALPAQARHAGLEVRRVGGPEGVCKSGRGPRASASKPRVVRRVSYSRALRSRVTSGPRSSQRSSSSKRAIRSEGRTSSATATLRIVVRVRIPLAPLDRAHEAAVESAAVRDLLLCHARAS